MSLAIWDLTVLPATWHKWTHPALTPAIQAGTRFTYARGNGRLSWLIWLDSAPAASRTSDPSITSPMLNHCSTKTTNNANYNIENNIITTGTVTMLCWCHNGSPLSEFIECIWFKHKTAPIADLWRNQWTWTICTCKLPLFIPIIVESRLILRSQGGLKAE